MHQLNAYCTWESTGGSPALPEKCGEHQGAHAEGWRVDGEGKGSLQMFCDYSEVSCRETRQQGALLAQVARADSASRSSRRGRSGAPGRAGSSDPQTERTPLMSHLAARGCGAVLPTDSFNRGLSLLP